MNSVYFSPNQSLSHVNEFELRPSFLDKVIPRSLMISIIPRESEQRLSVETPSAYKPSSPISAILSDNMDGDQFIDVVKPRNSAVERIIDCNTLGEFLDQIRELEDNQEEKGLLIDYFFEIAKKMNISHFENLEHYLKTLNPPLSLIVPQDPPLVVMPKEKVSSVARLHLLRQPSHHEAVQESHHRHRPRHCVIL